MRLRDKVAVITGAGNGIGRAIAIRFAQEGALVVINDIDAASGESLASAIGAEAGRAIFVQGDAAAEADVAALMTAIEETFGALDILVNNVVPNEEEVCSNRWEKMLDVGLKSYWLCMRAALPLMRRPGANVVNISSVNALMGFGKEHVYSGVKAAILGLSRSMAGELSPRGIRINCICPGTIVTDRWKDRFAQDAGLELRLAALYPIRRLGRPEDIASAAVFLASDEASFITGSILTVDGGLTAVNTGFIK